MITTYSHSALKTFRDCPRKFKFQYIEKPAIPKRVGAEAYLGSAVHRVMQVLYQRGNDGVMVPLDDALKLYHAEWAKVDKELVDVSVEFMGVDDYIRNGAEMIRRHYERYQPFRPGVLLGAEMSLTFNLPGTPFKLRGIIDRIVKREDGSVEICDYKTGKNLPRPTDPDFFYQMGIYQLAVMQHYPQFTDIEVAQYFLKMNEEVRLRLREDDLDKLTEDIRQVVLAIAHANKLDEFPVSESTLCRYCDYYALCPAKRHQQMIEECPDDPQAAPRQAYDKASEYIVKYALSKELAAEMDALREDLTRLADELKVSKFAGAGGEISLATKKEEKFVTKTDDPQAFSDLSETARQLGLDIFFKLDGAALMKEAVLKKRLDPSAIEKLAPFVRCKESTTLRVKLVKEEEDE